MLMGGCLLHIGITFSLPEFSGGYLSFASFVFFLSPTIDPDSWSVTAASLNMSE